LLKIPTNYTLIATKLEEAMLNVVNSTMIIQLNLLKRMHALSVTAASWGFSFYRPEAQLRLRQENLNIANIKHVENLTSMVIIKNFF
jgi:hypothetical protein